MQLNKNINRNLLKEQSFPSYNINNNEDCILHFGIGNFHRAHQALYIHEILENNKNISIIGVNLRSEETNNKMQAQDYLYSLERISNNYKKKYFPPKSFLKILHKRFSPYCSVATWYLWRSIDNEPIQY